MTRFDFRHWVQTRRRRVRPSTIARTRCRLGYQRRLVLLFAGLMLCPVMGPLPQISHTRAIGLHPTEHERHSEAGRKAAETYSGLRGRATPPDGGRSGSDRTGRVGPGGGAGAERLRGGGRRAAHVTRLLRADRTPARQDPRGARRPARPALAHDRHPRRPAPRGVQPRGPELRADVVDPARVDGRVHGAGRHAHPRGRSTGAPGGPLLSGQLVRDVRQGGRDPAAGDDALLPAVPVRRGQGLRTLDRGQLSRVLWALRRERHLLQSRVAPARARVRQPQGEPRRGADREGKGERAAARQSRRAARLGLRRGLRRGHVAHAAAAGARRLRRGDGAAAHGARAVRGGLRPRESRLAPVREGGPAARASGGGGYLAGRRDQGARPARLGAPGELRGAGAHDGGRGPGASGVRVLVNGADGFVGRWMVRRLGGDGGGGGAAGRPGGPAGPPAGPAELSAAERAAVRWLPLELADFESVRQCARAPCDAVVHLAAVSSGVEAARDPGWAWTVNAAGTARLVHRPLQAKRAGPGDPAGLVSSTAEVYGRGDPTPRKESDPVAPCSPYAASKTGAQLPALQT